MARESASSNKWKDKEVKWIKDRQRQRIRRNIGVGFPTWLPYLFSTQQLIWPTNITAA